MVMKLRNTRTIIIGFFIFALIFFLYSDSLVNSINSLNPILGLLVITLLNPVYLIFIWSLNKEYGVRGLLAGFLISIAADAISLPHFLTLSGQHSTVSTNLVTELTFWNVFPEWLRTTTINLPGAGLVNLGTFLIYVALTTVMIIVALMIAHNRRFKEIFWRAA